MKKTLLYLILMGLFSTSLSAKWLWFNPATQKCTDSLSPQEWAKDKNIVSVKRQGNIWELTIRGGRKTWVTNDNYICSVTLMRKTNVQALTSKYR